MTDGWGWLDEKVEWGEEGEEGDELLTPPGVSTAVS